MIVIKYVPHVGDSKRAMDEYSSRIFCGGSNTIAIHVSGQRYTHMYHRYHRNVSSRLACNHGSASGKVSGHYLGRGSLPAPPDIAG